MGFRSIQIIMLSIRMKRITVITVLIYVFVLSVGCSPTRYVVKDYSDFVGNLFRYYVQSDTDRDNDKNAEIDDKNDSDKDNISEPDPIEVEIYPGLKNIGNYKFDNAKAFFGNYAYAERNGQGYLIDRNGNCTKVNKSSENTSPDIVLEDIKYDKLLVKSGEKYGVVLLNGTILLDTKYERVEIKDDIVAGFDGKQIVVYSGTDKKFEIEGHNFSILSETFIQIDSDIRVVESGEIAKIGAYRVWDAPSEGIVQIADSNNRFGFCSYPDGKILIDSQYFTASSFSEGVACVAKYKPDYEHAIFYDYNLLIDAENSVLFDFSVFKDKYLPSEITIYPRVDNHCVVKFGTATNRYGAVKFSGNDTEYFKLAYEPAGYRFYGNNYIIRESGALFSTDKNAIISGKYSNVAPVCDSLFLASSDTGTFSILDKEFNEIVKECEFVDYYEDMLLIKKNSTYAYYCVA